MSDEVRSLLETTENRPPDREIEKYRQLACAVILQFMEDFEEAYARKLQGFYMNEDHHLTLEWVNTEWAQFWCEVAGLDIEKLRKWVEKKNRSLKRLTRLWLCLRPSCLSLRRKG